MVKKDFFIMNSDTIKQTIESTTGTMKLLISSIAFISLIVGGIGVMNIMFGFRDRTNQRNWCANGYWGKTI